MYDTVRSTVTVKSKTAHSYYCIRYFTNRKVIPSFPSCFVSLITPHRTEQTKKMKLPNSALFIALFLFVSSNSVDAGKNKGKKSIRQSRKWKSVPKGEVVGTNSKLEAFAHRQETQLTIHFFMVIFPYLQEGAAPVGEVMWRLQRMYLSLMREQVQQPKYPLLHL